MQNGRSVRTVYYVIWILLLLSLSLSFSQAHGEQLFRWRDDAGRLCYSNVSPPAGINVYSADAVINSASGQPRQGHIPTDIETAEKMPTDDVHLDSSAVFLEKRITERKTSIGHMETLLRKHPNDQALRKRLLRKKQYLFEDLTRLESVNGQSTEGSQQRAD